MTTSIARPNNVEAEREILSACFNASGSYGKDDVIKYALGALDPEYFAHPHYQKIFIGLQEAVLDSSGRAVDWGDVRGYIDSKSAARETLKDIVTNSNLPPVTESFCDRTIKKLASAYKSRKLYMLAKSIEVDALAGNDELAFDVLADGMISLSRDRFAIGAQYIKEFIPEVLEEISERRTKKGLIGLRTGLAPIDYVWKGLQRKNLYFIGARPGHGKSMAAGQVCDSVTEFYPEKRVLLATTEMDARQYITRLAATKVGLDYDDYNGGKYDENVEQLLVAAVRDLEDRKLIVNPSGTQSIQTLRQDIIRYQPHLLVVDYAQEFYPTKPTNNEYRDVSNFIRELNAMKKDFDLPILCAVQLSREVENRPDKRPRSSDARGSGWLEQAADGIFMLYRAKEYATPSDIEGVWFDDMDNEVDPTTLEWICTKNRHGKKLDVMTYVKDGEMIIRNEKDWE